MTKHKDITVYIGRFNPFHNGHVRVLEEALKTSKLVVVLIGSAFKARSPKNPFTFDERKAMIMNWTHGLDQSLGKLVVAPIRDCRSNNIWIQSVQDTVKRVVKAHCNEWNLILTDTYITGSDRDESTWYLKSFPQWKQDLLEPFYAPDDNEVSGTSVRKVLYESKMTPKDVQSLSTKLPATTLAFLRHFAGSEAHETLRREHSFILKSKEAWARSPYTPTFQCADAVVIQSGHVLAIVRAAEPGKGLWAVPGGYVKSNQTIKEAAIDELVQETGLRLAEGKRGKEITEAMLNGSIRAQENFDDPNRSERGRIFTTAFLMRLDDKKPLPKVAGQNVPLDESNGEIVPETSAAMWLTFEQAFSNPEKWFEDHLEIVEWGVSVKD